MPDREAHFPPSLRSVFFPTDLSPGSERAFGHARLLASRFAAGVTIYHALEIPAARWVRAAGREEELRRTLAAEARADLERRAASLGVPHEVVVDDDVSAADCLVDIAVLRRVQATRPDLVVMASHSRSALDSFFLGSVAQEVLAHAGRPVLVVGPRSEATPAGYRRILVPTDLSEASARAFPYAALLASRFDADLVALHVFPRPILSALADIPRALAAAVPDPSTLRAFVDGRGGARMRPRVEQGAPWERIVAVAREEHADLIVMATNGADGIGERVLGSQTERVVRHAHCPVLAV
ncbi:MAG: universal stress protein [Vicinamibacteria bacterium]